jgi:hypothetical protein
LSDFDGPAVALRGYGAQGGPLATYISRRPPVLAAGRSSRAVRGPKKQVAQEYVEICTQPLRDELD